MKITRQQYYFQIILVITGDKIFLRDAVINGEIKLEYTNTTEQRADGLTKALTPDQHLQGVRGLLSSYQMSKTI